MTRHVFDALIALACVTLLTLALTSPVQADDTPQGSDALGWDNPRVRGCR